MHCGIDTFARALELLRPKRDGATRDPDRLAGWNPCTVGFQARHTGEIRVSLYCVGTLQDFGVGNVGEHADVTDPCIPTIAEKERCRGLDIAAAEIAPGALHRTADARVGEVKRLRGAQIHEATQASFDLIG